MLLRRLPVLIIYSLHPFISTQMGCVLVMLPMPREASAQRLLLGVPVTLGFNVVFCGERVFALCRWLRIAFHIVGMFKITPSATFKNFLLLKSVMQNSGLCTTPNQLQHAQSIIYGWLNELRGEKKHHIDQAREAMGSSAV